MGLELSRPVALGWGWGWGGREVDMGTHSAHVWSNPKMDFRNSFSLPPFMEEIGIFLGSLGKLGLLVSQCWWRSFLNWIPSLPSFYFLSFCNANKSSCWRFRSSKMLWVWGFLCGFCSSLGLWVARLQRPGGEEVHLLLLKTSVAKWPWQWTSVNAREVTHPRENWACVLDIILWVLLFLFTGPLALPAGSVPGHPLPARPACLVVEIY